MKYINIIEGIENKRFWDLKIDYRDNKIFLDKHLSHTNVLSFEISQNILMNLISFCSIDQGFISKYLTFLENEEGFLEPFPSDSNIVKSAMKEAGFCLSPSDLKIGQKVEFFKESFSFYYNSPDIYYFGKEESSKNYLFLISHVRQTSNVNQKALLRRKTFPFIYKAFDEFLDISELDNIPF